MLFLEYFKILIFFIVTAMFMSMLIAVSFLLNKDSGLPNKKKPVECGSHLFGSGKASIEMNFFMIAMIFVVFEIELLVIVPWVLFFNSFSVFSFVWVILFLFMLMMGLLIEYLNCNFNL